MALGNTANSVRHGGGKQGDLPLLRGLFKNPLDIVDKSHAQHLIGLVQYQGLQFCQLEGAAAHMVHHPAGCAHYHVHPSLQLAQLPAHIGTAINWQDMKPGQVARIFLEGFCHLNRQFASGSQHKYLRQLLLEIQARQDGQRKSRSFPRAGLGLSKHIGPFKHMGDDSCLDSRGRFVANLYQGFVQGRGQFQFGKTGNPIWSGHVLTLRAERGASNERGRGLYRETGRLSVAY